MKPLYGKWAAGRYFNAARERLEDDMKRKIFAIPMMALATACLMVLSACQTGPTPQELIKKDLETQLSTISAEDEDFMDAMEAGGGSSFTQLGIETDEFAKAYLDGFSYEMGDVTVDEKGESATAAVTLKIKPMTTIMTDFQTAFEEQAAAAMADGSVTSQSDLYELGGQILLDTVKAAEPEETKCEFEYAKDKDGAWAMESSAASELMSALF